MTLDDLLVFGSRACGDAEPDSDQAKSHATIIRGFGPHIVREHGLDAWLGRIPSRTEDQRYVADYSDKLTPAQEAKAVIAELEVFLLETAAVLTNP